MAQFSAAKAGSGENRANTHGIEVGPAGTCLADDASSDVTSLVREGLWAGAVTAWWLVVVLLVIRVLVAWASPS